MTQKRRGIAKPQVTVVAIDTSEADKEKVPDDAWWVFVMPSQEAAPEAIPTGRYGWWAEKPNVVETTLGYTINPSKTFEPSIFIPAANVISVYVAQMKHAVANPEVPIANPE